MQQHTTFSGIYSSPALLKLCISVPPRPEAPRHHTITPAPSSLLSFFVSTLPHRLPPPQLPRNLPRCAFEGVCGRDCGVFFSLAYGSVMVNLENKNLLQKVKLINILRITKLTDVNS